MKPYNDLRSEILNELWGFFIYLYFMETLKKTRGVTFISARVKKPWRAKCHFNGKGHHVGYYDTEKEAIDALGEFLIRKTSVYSLTEITIATQALKCMLEMMKHEISNGTIDKFMSGIDRKTDVKLFDMFIEYKSSRKKEDNLACLSDIDRDLNSRKLINETSFVFIDWMDKKTAFIVGNSILGKTLYESFISENDIYKDQLSLVNFYNWIDLYCEDRLGQKPSVRKVVDGKELTFSMHSSKTEVKL